MRVRQRTRSLRAVWAPSLARRLVRHRGVQAAVIIGVGIATAMSLSAKMEAVEAARSSWGDLTTVAVVTAPVAVGEPVADRVGLRELPLELVPPNAVSTIVAGSVAKVALFPGEVVLQQRITGGRTGIEPGTVALTLPVAAHVPLVNEGDLVDLWVVDSANFSSRRVAERVVVLALGERDITVAVPEAQVADATVASLRPVTIAMVG